MPVSRNRTLEAQFLIARRARGETIHQVADGWGVSVMTIYRALDAGASCRAGTRERVLRLVKDYARGA